MNEHKRIHELERAVSELYEYRKMVEPLVKASLKWSDSKIGSENFYDFMLAWENNYRDLCAQKQHLWSGDYKDFDMKKWIEND